MATPMVGHERLGQLYCLDCGKAVGFTGQGTAYASMLRVGWLCGKDNEAEAREMRERASDTITRKRKS